MQDEPALCLWRRCAVGLSDDRQMVRADGFERIAGSLAKHDLDDAGMVERVRW